MRVPHGCRDQQLPADKRTQYGGYCCYFWWQWVISWLDAFHSTNGYFVAREGIVRILLVGFRNTFPNVFHSKLAQFRISLRLLVSTILFMKFMCSSSKNVPSNIDSWTRALDAHKGKHQKWTLLLAKKLSTPKRAVFSSVRISTRTAFAWTWRVSISETAAPPSTKCMFRFRGYRTQPKCGHVWLCHTTK